jgi:hypothetical protein
MAKKYKSKKSFKNFILLKKQRLHLFVVSLAFFALSATYQNCVGLLAVNTFFGMLPKAEAYNHGVCPGNCFSNETCVQEGDPREQLYTCVMNPPTGGSSGGTSDGGTTGGGTIDGGTTGNTPPPIIPIVKQPGECIEPGKGCCPTTLVVSNLRSLKFPNNYPCTFVKVGDHYNMKISWKAAAMANLDMMSAFPAGMLTKEAAEAIAFRASLREIVSHFYTYADGTQAWLVRLRGNGTYGVERMQQDATGAWNSLGWVSGQAYTRLQEIAAKWGMVIDGTTGVLK